MTGKWVTTLVPEPAAGSLPHGSPGDKPQDARERGTMREKTPGTPAADSGEFLEEIPEGEAQGLLPPQLKVKP